jgi:hypothetical protein
MVSEFSWIGLPAWSNRDRSQPLVFSVLPIPPPPQYSFTRYKVDAIDAWQNKTGMPSVVRVQLACCSRMVQYHWPLFLLIPLPRGTACYGCCIPFRTVLATINLSIESACSTTPAPQCSAPPTLCWPSPTCGLPPSSLSVLFSAISSLVLPFLTWISSPVSRFVFFFYQLPCFFLISLLTLFSSISHLSLIFHLLPYSLLSFLILLTSSFSYLFLFFYLSPCCLILYLSLLPSTISHLIRFSVSHCTIFFTLCSSSISCLPLFFYLLTGSLIPFLTLFSFYHL